MKMIQMGLRLESNLSSRSVLASPGGYAATGKRRKLCNRIPEHERSNVHRECYLGKLTLENLIKLHLTKWSNILKRILDVILFLGERGLAFRGSSQRFGDVDNGNFLNLIELLSHWDSILKEHVLSVEESQRKGKRLQVHYLSADTQNEFIPECSDLVQQHILQERRSAKYFAIMVNATPDSSYTEQTTFILRYVILKDSQYEIVE
ncbi:zinc finger MYM-type protein 1-like [Hydra vulgaris]|uniref:zinc finger MYM-type protein 1-like n=1 Tax=Hydra vulgaris TaxID=6087 RepID=UPI0002B45588|nr:zinc finger MYM-type protein 1-like [Hydra vulgaris]